MIARLTGRVDGTGKDWLVLDVGGVGYLVYCSARTLGSVAGGGDAVSLEIETHVREDHIHLYGFAEALERDWFRLLTTVQGVGAKVGLAILSALSPDNLTAAIAAGDAAPLTQASGVGRKLAGRMISELQDKVGDLALSSAIGTEAGAPVPAGIGPADQASRDAVSALDNLGDGRTEAFAAVARAAGKLGPEAEVESLIRGGLGELAPADAHA